MNFTQSLILSLLLVLLDTSIAWTTIEPTTTTSTSLSSSSSSQQQHKTHNDQGPIGSNSMTTRRSFLPVISTTVASTAAIMLGPSLNGSNNNNPLNRNVGNLAMAADVIPDTNEKSPNPSSKLNLSDDELIQIIRDDILQRQFLVTGNITKFIYAPDATFTDEIDTYGMDQWMIGTQRLFVGDRSQVRLVNDQKITFTSPTTIEFAFDEDLMFNLPIIKPIVSLTGKVVLTRDPNTGYIKSYREYWDQDVATVLKSAKF